MTGVDCQNTHPPPSDVQNVPPGWKKWISNSPDVSPLFYRYCLISARASQTAPAPSHELMILQINLIWSLINFPNDKSMSKIMKGGVIQCVCPAASPSRSGDALSEGQVWHFLFLQRVTLFPNASGMVNGQNTDFSPRLPSDTSVSRRSFLVLFSASKTSFLFVCFVTVLCTSKQAENGDLRVRVCIIR